MILSDMRSYLQHKQQASLGEISTHFHIEADAARGMLDKWIGKGKVRRQAAASCQSGCCKCDPLLTEIYQWVGKTELD